MKNILLSLIPNNFSSEFINQVGDLLSRLSYVISFTTCDFLCKGFIPKFAIALTHYVIFTPVFLKKLIFTVMPYSSRNEIFYEVFSVYSIAYTLSILSKRVENNVESGNSEYKIEVRKDAIESFQKLFKNTFEDILKQRNLNLSESELNFLTFTSAISCIIFVVEVYNFSRKYNVIDGIRNALDLYLTSECRIIISELTPGIVT